MGRRTGPGRVYRRPESPYWYLAYTGYDGEEVRESSKRTLKSEAEEVLRRKVQDVLDAKQLGHGQVQTISQVSGACWAIAKTRGRAKSYLNRMEKVGETLVRIVGDIPIHELTQDNVENYATTRADEGLSASTINLELRHIAGLVAHCRRRDVRPPRHIQMPYLKERPKLRWLTAQQECDVIKNLDERVVSHKTISEAHHQLRKDFFVFLIDTGARLSEAQNLTWNDIDTDASWTVLLDRPKTDTMTRIAPTKRLRSILRRRYEASRTKWVFPHPYDHHEPVKSSIADVLNRAIAEVCNQDAKVVERNGRATVHSLRDTFASRLVQQGVSLFKVQRLLGHSSPKQTMKYSHLVPDDIAEEAAEILDTYLAQ